jgi:hypothetical protein
MIEELRRVIEEMQQQPEDAQRDLAKRIEEWLAEEEEEREWDALVSSPTGQAALERLVAEAREEIAQGKTRDLEDIL